jgi:hypothetical protein
MESMKRGTAPEPKEYYFTGFAKKEDEDNLRDALNLIKHQVPEARADLKALYDSFESKDGPDKKLLEHVQKWFGDADSKITRQDVKAIYDKFDLIEKGTQKLRIRFVRVNRSDFAAESVRADYTINIANNFYRDYDTNRRERAFIIFHELTHYYAGTVDYRQGDKTYETVYLTKPADDPSKTITYERHADDGTPVPVPLKKQDRLNHADIYAGYFRDYYLPE